VTASYLLGLRFRVQIPGFRGQSPIMV